MTFPFDGWPLLGSTPENGKSPFSIVKHIFKWWIFQPVMLVFLGVRFACFRDIFCWCFINIKYQSEKNQITNLNGLQFFICQGSWKAQKKCMKLFNLKMSLGAGISPETCVRITFVVSTHLKNISQIGNLPQIGVNIQNVWNHHLDETFFLANYWKDRSKAEPQCGFGDVYIYILVGGSNPFDKY